MRVTSSSNAHTSTQHLDGSSESLPSASTRTSSTPISFLSRCRLLSKDTLAESPSASGHSDSIKVEVLARTPPLATNALSKSSGRFCTLRLKTTGCPSRSRANCPSAWIFSGHARGLS